MGSGRLGSCGVWWGVVGWGLVGSGLGHFQSF